MSPEGGPVQDVVIRGHLEEVPDAARTWHEVGEFIGEPAAGALEVPPRSLADYHLAKHCVLDHASEVGGMRVGHHSHSARSSRAADCLTVS